MMTRDCKYDDLLEQLKKIAMISEISFRHAAALIKGSTIYSSGHNKYIKEIEIKGVKNKLYKTIHAEVDVISNFPYKKSIKGMDIIVIRINKGLSLRNSRPCSDCICKLEKVGIRKVFYSDEKGRLVSEFVEDMPKIHTSGGTRYFNKCIAETLH